MGWSSAAEVFEEFARRGLTTASAIERAYKQDSKLLWKMVAAFDRVENYISQLVGKLSQVISYSEYYGPFFKRWSAFTFNFPV